MNTKQVALLSLVVITLLLLTSALFTVNQTQQALVLRFGQIVRVEQDPGLRFKLPLLEDVVFLEKRVLDVDPPVEPVLLADQKRLEVDAFARYKITDPAIFYERFRTEANAQSRLSAIVNSSLRRVLGSATLLAVLSSERAKVMEQIKEQVNLEARPNGIEIVDVRIRRADLPEATSQSVYQRMSSERAREAAEARAQGQELAQQIRSMAERERTVILAEAQRNAQILRGEGDFLAFKILSDAAGRNAEFYQFYRSLEAYRAALRKDNTTMVLSPDSSFFQYFQGLEAARKETKAGR